MTGASAARRAERMHSGYGAAVAGGGRWFTGRQALKLTSYEPTGRQPNGYGQTGKEQDRPESGA